MKARALVAWNLRRIRVKCEISQERLAYDSQVDRSYVGGLERLTQNPTIDLLDRLAGHTWGTTCGVFYAAGQRSPCAKALPKGRKVAHPKRKKP
jgi:transcriptional regulator with XRE-family HTH domain